MEGREYLSYPGLEYLSVVVPDCRMKVFAALGSSPKFGKFCDYVRDSESVVLSKELCAGLAVGHVDGSHVQLFTVVSGAFDLYSALVRCSFVRRDYLDGQQLACFSLSFGSPAFARLAVGSPMLVPHSTSDHGGAVVSRGSVVSDNVDRRASAIVRVHGRVDGDLVDVGHGGATKFRDGLTGGSAGVVSQFARVGEVLRGTGKSFGARGFPGLEGYESLFHEAVRGEVQSKLGDKPTVVDVTLEYCYQYAKLLRATGESLSHTHMVDCQFAFEFDGDRFVVDDDPECCVFIEMFAAVAKSIEWWFLSNRGKADLLYDKYGDIALDGFCYLKLFDKAVRESVATRRGFAPSVDMICVELMYAVLKGVASAECVNLQCSRPGLLHATVTSGDSFNLGKLVTYYDKGYVIGAGDVLGGVAEQRDVSSPELTAYCGKGLSIGADGAPDSFFQLKEFSQAHGSRRLDQCLNGLHDLKELVNEYVREQKPLAHDGDCVVYCTRVMKQHVGHLDTAMSAYPTRHGDAVYYFGAITEDSVVFLPRGAVLYKDGFQVSSDEGVFLHVVAGAGFQVLVADVLSKLFVRHVVPDGACWTDKLEEGLSTQMFRLARVKCSRSVAYSVLAQRNRSYHLHSDVRYAMQRTDHIVRLVHNSSFAQQTSVLGAAKEDAWVEVSDPYDSWKAIGTYRALLEADCESMAMSTLFNHSVVVIDSFNVQSGLGSVKLGPVVVHSGTDSRVAVDVCGFPDVDLTDVKAPGSLYVSMVVSTYCYDDGGSSDGGFSDGFEPGRCGI